MNTSTLKRFATEARTKVKQGVALMMSQWGFDANGRVYEEPVLLQGGTMFRQQILEGEHIFHQWQALSNKIEHDGLRQVYEEVAYTWFNRIIAIKILSKNGLLEPYLDYASTEGHPTTSIVAQARRGIFPPMSEATRRKVLEIVDDHRKEAELLALLIIEVCHNTPILKQCFGRLNDYTELLFPRTMATQGDLLDMLNDSSLIVDEDYRQPELIGWLYQFYIAERKDEVFAQFKNNKKASKDDIPAATQIFTPNWIVKYMVQNTLGRIYLDNTPHSSLAPQWQYLITPAEDNVPEQHTLQIKEAEELTLIDAACGSGHILVEAFDLLYSIYEEQYASPREACEAILSHNLVGIDIDTRAKQLAQFALLIKACSYVPEMVDCRVMPRIFDMPEPLPETVMEELRDSLPHFFLGGSEQVVKETIAALQMLQHAPELGSVMKLSLSTSTRYAIEQALERSEIGGFPYTPQLHLALALTQKYAAVVMNPPYMGRKNMNSELAKYVERHYPEGKADLCTTFMLIAKEMLQGNGKMGLVTMESWMFLSSYEKLRVEFLSNYRIDSLSHFDWHIMHIAFGTVSFIITNAQDPAYKGTYSYLYRTEMDWELDIPKHFPNKTNNRYKRVSQKTFEQIPGTPIAYWVSEKMRETFLNPLLGEICIVKKGADTSDNDYFLRQWHELSYSKLGIYQKNSDEFNLNGYKWAPYNKGGQSRKWYGNNSIFILWENGGVELMSSKGNLRSKHLYFKDAITWNALSSDKTTARFSDYGAIFDSAGSSMFPEKDNIFYLLAYMNSSSVANILSTLNPTLNYGAGTVASLPYVDIEDKTAINSIVIENISISREDWDAHETSWDFKENELVRLSRTQGVKKLSEVMERYKEYWGAKFDQLHANEEELNRQFIDLYGLQDELSPEVPLSEVTILQQGEIGIEGGELCWNEAEVMQQLISYAMGIWMGRYRLDNPGLHIAHPAPTAEEMAPYAHGDTNIAIDDDGIVPLLPDDAPFADNARERIVGFLATVFGQEHLVDNLNFVEQTLGKSLTDYLLKDYWKQHKTMYQNKPIYWLFRSPKGAFQCLAYMHRMDEYTLERIRQKYLLPYISHLSDRASALQARDSLSTVETKQLSKLKTLLEECREYHDRLHQYSEQNLSFDLDDGVVCNYALLGDIVAKLK